MNSRPTPAQLTRRQALGAGATAAGLGALAWGTGRGYASNRESARNTTDHTPVRIGYLPITDSTALLVGHGNGYYTDAGVPTTQPIMFRSWSSLSEAFVSGQVDVIHMLMPMALYMRYGLQADVLITAWNHTNGSALTTGPGITTVEDLAGRSLAIPAWWSVHNVVVQQILRASGLTPVMRQAASAEQGTVTLLPMAPADMLPALNNGVIGGYTVADPFNAAAEAQQVGHIHRFTGDVWHNHVCCVTMMRGELLRNRPHLAAGFMDGLVRAQAWSRENRPEAATLLAKHYLPQPAKVIKKALIRDSTQHADTVNHPNWHGERIDFRPWPYQSTTELLVRSMQETVVDAPTDFLAGLDPAQAHQELVDDSLVWESLQRLGGMEVFGLSGTERTEEFSA